MAIDFPGSPTNGQTFTSGSVTYTWDGTKWTAVASGGGGATDKIEEGNTSAEVIDTGSDGRFVVTTEGAEALRVDASRRLLVGTSSWGSTVRAVFSGNSTDNDETYVTLNRGTKATGANGAIGFIGFTNGGSGENCASIACWTDAASGTGDNPGRLTFSTTADGASSPTERMRLTNEGQLRIGSRIDLNPDQDLGGSGTNRSVGFFNGTSGSNIASNVFNASTTATHLSFYNLNGKVGSITTAGSATTYATSSDYRLKENITSVTDGIARLQQLKPSRFNFIADPNTVVDGFIAHEVQAIVPEAITGEKDAVDDEGKPEYQGIDQSKLVPLLTAALQEAVAKIESLEARLTAAGI